MKQLTQLKEPGQILRIFLILTLLWTSCSHTTKNITDPCYDDSEQSQTISEYGLTAEKYNNCVKKFNMCRELLIENDAVLDACVQQLEECKKDKIKEKATVGGFGFLLGIILGLLL